MKKSIWAVAIVLVSGKASAQVLEDVNFDSGFTLGELSGQNGWLALPGDTLPFVLPGMATVSSAAAHSGTRSARLNSALLFPGESVFAFKPLSTPISTGLASVVISEFWIRYSSANPGATVGGTSYDSTGSSLGGMTIASQTGQIFPTWLAGASTLPNVSANQWIRMTAVHNMLTSQMRGYVNGNLVSTTSGSFANTDFSDFDFYADGSGANETFFDDYKVEKVNFGTIRGTAALGDYGAPPTGTPIRIRLLNNTTGAVVQTFNTTLNSSSEFTVSTNNRGIFKVEIKPWHWVSKTIANVSVTDEGVFFLSSVHTNGDTDNSDEVDAVDIDLVIADFGNVGSPTSIAADIDGSGEVDAVDIDVVISRFGAVGD